MRERIQIGIVFFMIFISLRFFDATFISKNLVNYTEFFGITIASGISLFFIPSSNKGFILPVKIIVASVFVSMALANVTWDQNFKMTLIATYPYFIWLFFFYLIRAHLPIKKIEQIILIFGFLYIILYIYQFLRGTEVLFGKPLYGEDFNENRGIVRMIFPGAGVFLLSIFIAICKITTKVKSRHVWWGLAFLGIVIPVMQATRQFFFGIILIYVIHFYRGRSLYNKIVVFLFVIITVIFFKYSNILVVKGMRGALESDMKLGENYVRVKAGIFFLKDFSPSDINRVFGNGVPYWGYSFYGRYVENIAANKGFYLSDVGIIAVYAMFGLLAVYGLFLIWKKSFMISVSEEYLYVRYYLWYLLLTSFTWYSVYHYYYLISTILVLYIYHRITTEASFSKHSE